MTLEHRRKLVDEGLLPVRAREADVALLFARLDNRLVVLCLWTTVAFGVLGGIDDRIKLLGLPDPRNPGKTRRGIDAKSKLLGQAAIALVAIACPVSITPTMRARCSR